MAAFKSSKVAMNELRGEGVVLRAAMCSAGHLRPVVSSKSIQVLNEHIRLPVQQAQENDYVVEIHVGKSKLALEGCITVFQIVASSLRRLTPQAGAAVLLRLEKDSSALSYITTLLCMAAHDHSAMQWMKMPSDAISRTNIDQEHSQYLAKARHLLGCHEIKATYDIPVHNLADLLAQALYDPNIPSDIDIHAGLFSLSKRDIKVKATSYILGISQTQGAMMLKSLDELTSDFSRFLCIDYLDCGGINLYQYKVVA